MGSSFKLLATFISANILWYFILAFIHFETNILEWWAVNNIFGRILLTLLELSIIFTSLDKIEKDDNREQDNNRGESE